MDDIHLDIATSYDRENRGVPRLFAAHIARLSSPVDESSVIHDNGCGPAVVTTELFLSLPNKARIFKVEATDLSAPMVTASNEVIKSHGWKHVKATVMDSKHLSFDNNTFTHSFTNFLVPIQREVFGEIYRTLRPGGVAIYTTWKNHSFSDLMHRCTSVIFPNFRPAAHAENQWLDENAVREHFERAGFGQNDIQVQSHREILSFNDVQDLLSIVRGPFGRFFTKDWNEEDLEKLPHVIEAALTAEELESRSLDMVAWVVVAKKA